MWNKHSIEKKKYFLNQMIKYDNILQSNFEKQNNQWIFWQNILVLMIN